MSFYRPLTYSFTTSFEFRNFPFFPLIPIIIFYLLSSYFWRHFVTSRSTSTIFQRNEAMKVEFIRKWNVPSTLRCTILFLSSRVQLLDRLILFVFYCRHNRFEVSGEEFKELGASSSGLRKKAEKTSYR